MSEIDFNDEEALKAYIEKEIKTRVILACLRDYIICSFAAMLYGLSYVTAQQVADDIKEYYGVTIPLENIEKELAVIQKTIAPTMPRGILAI